MAKFEPRPPRPPGGDFRRVGDDPITDRLSQADEMAERLDRRLRLPRLRWPRALRERYARLPQDVRYRIEVVWGFVQTGLFVIFGTLALVLIFKAVSGMTFVEPKTARKVLEQVKDPRDVAYGVETIRVKDIDSSLLRIDSVRGFQVDPKRRKLMSIVSGVDVSPFRLLYDGETTLFKPQDKQIRRLTDRQFTTDQLRPVYASDLVPVAGKILNAKATVDSQRGWLLSWKPTSAILLRLLSADMLGLRDPDIQAIRRGRFRTRFATATVLRSGKRLYQIDTTIYVNDAQLRILATYRQQNTGRLDDFVISDGDDTEVN